MQRKGKKIFFIRFSSACLSFFFVRQSPHFHLYHNKKMSAGWSK